MTEASGHSPIDRRQLAYLTVKRIVLLVAAVFLVRLLFVEIAVIKNEAMAPTIIRGDRVLVFRLPSLSIVRAMIKPARNRIVLFRFHFEKKTGCLRIAAVSGDTITIDNGAIRNSSTPALRIPPPAARLLRDLVPADFAPRDFLPTLRVPAPGDSFLLDSLDLFHFFTALSVIRQENPHRAITLKPVLSVDGSVSNDYFISDFTLYKGRLDAVPDSIRYSWFFWDRLNAYLHRDPGDNRKIDLSFEIFLDGTRLIKYSVKNRYLFLVADNWERGLDSRYFGPVAENKIIGRPVCVVWAKDKKRIGKIIH
jgi:signal peptidase I